jgi:hypothetical protein
MNIHIPTIICNLTNGSVGLAVFLKSITGHVARMGEGRGAYRVLVGRPKGRRPLGRPRCRWEDNIKMDLGEIGIDGVNWIWLAQDRVQWQAFVNTMNLWVP